MGSCNDGQKMTIETYHVGTALLLPKRVKESSLTGGRRPIQTSKGSGIVVERMDDVRAV